MARRGRQHPDHLRLVSSTIEASNTDGGAFRLGDRVQVRGRYARIQPVKGYQGRDEHDILIVDIVAIGTSEQFGEQWFRLGRTFLGVGLEHDAVVEFAARVAPCRESVDKRDLKGLPCDTHRLVRPSCVRLVHADEADSDSDMSGLDKLNVHPLARLMPLMAPADFARLVRDMRKNGQREKTLRHPDGSILDGRHRELAALKLGLQPQFDVWDEQGSALTEVLSRNLHRRHLSESQRAIIGARLKEMMEGESQAAVQGTPVANLPPHLRRGRAREVAAEMVNVSPRIIQDAVTVLRRGAPWLAGEVDRGNLRVHQAKRIAALPREKQDELVGLDPSTRNKAITLHLHRSHRDREGAASPTDQSVPVSGSGHPILLISPAWPQRSDSDRSERLAAIRDLPVSRTAAEGALLFVRTPSAMLEAALGFLRTWGFAYCDNLVLPTLPDAEFARQRHDLVLIAERGDRPLIRPDYDSILRLSGADENQCLADTVQQLILGSSVAEMIEGPGLAFRC